MAQNKDLVADAQTLLEENLSEKKSVESARRLAFTRCRNNFKTVGNLMIKNSLKDFDAKEMYLHPTNRSVSLQKRRKMLFFHHFELSKRCSFQNVPVRVPFSKSTVLKISRRKMSVFV